MNAPFLFLLCYSLNNCHILGNNNRPKRVYNDLNSERLWHFTFKPNDLVEGPRIHEIIATLMLDQLHQSVLFFPVWFVNFRFQMRTLTFVLLNFSNQYNDLFPTALHLRGRQPDPAGSQDVHRRERARAGREEPLQELPASHLKPFRVRSSATR